MKTTEELEKEVQDLIEANDKLEDRISALNKTIDSMEEHLRDIERDAKALYNSI